MQELNNIIVEHLDLQINIGFGGKFDVPYNYVIYFEKEQNVELSLYIRSNYEMLKTKFVSTELNFIYFPPFRIYSSPFYPLTRTSYSFPLFIPLLSRFIPPFRPLT